MNTRLVYLLFFISYWSQFSIADELALYRTETPDRGPVFVLTIAENPPAPKDKNTGDTQTINVLVATDLQIDDGGHSIALTLTGAVLCRSGRLSDKRDQTSVYIGKSTFEYPGSKKIRVQGQSIPLSELKAFANRWPKAN